MVASCVYFLGAFALKCGDVGPNCHAFLVAQSELALCIVATTVDVALIGQAKRVVGSSCNHNNIFS